jgi:transposase
VKSQDRANTSGSSLSHSWLEWRPDDEDRADPDNELAVENLATGGGGTAQCGTDLPLLRPVSPSLLQVEEAVRRAREAGLCDRPRTPHRSPRATPREVVSKILYLRQHYHFGPGRITGYLKRFHGVSATPSSVHRILSRHGLNRLPANQKHRPHAKRWIRYEKAQPGHRLQMDVKFLERIPGPGNGCISSPPSTIARAFAC